MRSQYVPPETLSALERRMQRANALALRVSAATGLRIGDMLALPCSALEWGQRSTMWRRKRAGGAASCPLARPSATRGGGWRTSVPRAQARDDAQPAGGIPRP